MSWERYYEHPDKVMNFSDNLDLFEPAIEKVKPQVVTKSLKRPLRLVLGGFNPGAGSPEQFKEFCASHLPGDHQIVMVDMNSLPLTSLDAKDFPFRVQGRLEDLPLRKKSVDFVFLNGVFNFCDNQQVTEIAESLSSVLRPKGMVLTAMNVPDFSDPAEKKEVMKRYRDLGLKPHFRSMEQLQSLMKPLEILDNQGSFGYELGVFRNKKR